MLQVFHYLNPIHFHSDKKIHSELEDVDMVIFVQTGEYAVGYEINYQESMKLKFNQTSVIGGFECSYNQRSIYIYKTRKVLKGYFIFKKLWK